MIFPRLMDRYVAAFAVPIGIALYFIYGGRRPEPLGLFLGAAAGAAGAIFRCRDIARRCVKTFFPEWAPSRLDILRAVLYALAAANILYLPLADRPALARSAIAAMLGGTALYPAVMLFYLRRLERDRDGRICVVRKRSVEE